MVFQYFERYTELSERKQAIADIFTVCQQDRMLHLFRLIFHNKDQASPRKKKKKGR